LEGRGGVVARVAPKEVAVFKATLLHRLLARLDLDVVGHEKVLQPTEAVIHRHPRRTEEKNQPHAQKMKQRIRRKIHMSQKVSQVPPKNIRCRTLLSVVVPSHTLSLSLQRLTMNARGVSPPTDHSVHAPEGEHERLREGSDNWLRPHTHHTSMQAKHAKMRCWRTGVVSMGR